MLVLIDLQNDYFDPRGKFYFPETKELTQRLIQRIHKAAESGEPIIYTLNIYTEEDGRTQEERDWASAVFEPFEELLGAELPLKKTYYGIPSEEAGKIVHKYLEESPQRIEVAGVETHLCVMANAVIIENMFPKAEIVLKRHMNKAGDHDLEEKAFAVMEGMNMKII